MSQDLQQQILSLQQQLKIKTEEYQNLQEEAKLTEEMLTQDIQQRDQIINQMKSQSQSILQTTNEDETTQQNSNQIRLINQLKAQITELKEKLEESEMALELQKEDFEKNKEQEQENFEKLLQHKENEIQTLLNKVQNFELQFHELEAELSLQQTKNNEQSETTQIAEQNKKLKLQIEKLEQQIKNQQQTNQQNEDYAQQIFKLQNQLEIQANVSIELEKLKEKYNQLQEKNDEIEDSDQQITEMSEKIKLLEENSNAKSQEILDLQYENEQLKLKNIPIVSNDQAIQREIEQQDIVELVEQCQQYEKAIQQLYQENRQLKESNDQLKESNDQIVVQSAGLLQQYENEINFYKENSQDQEVLTQEIQNLQQAQQTLLERIKLLEHDKNHYMEASEQNEKKYNDLFYQWKELNERFEYQQNKLNELQQTISEQSDEVEMLKQQLSEAELQNQKFDTKVDDLKILSNENNKLKQEVIQLQTAKQREELLKKEEIVKIYEQLNEWEMLMQIVSGNINSLNSKDVQVQQLINCFLKMQKMCEELQQNIELLNNEIEQKEQIIVSSKLEILGLKEQLNSLKQQEELNKKKTVRLSIYNNQIQNSDDLRIQLETLQTKYESLLLMKKRQDISEQAQNYEKEQIIQLELENTSLREQIRFLNLEQDQIRSKRHSSTYNQKLSTELNDELNKQIQEQNDIIEKYKNRIETLEKQLQNQQLIQEDEKNESEQFEQIEHFDEENHAPLIRQFDLSEYTEQIQQKEQNDQLWKQVNELQEQNRILVNQIKLLTIDSNDYKNLQSENAALKQEISLIKQYQKQENEAQFQQYSPLNILKVQTFLKQKDSNRKPKEKQKKQCLIIENETNPASKKKEMILQKLLLEQNQKINKNQDAYFTIIQLLRNVVQDIKKKYNILKIEEITKKSQVLLYLNKLKQSAEIILNKLLIVQNNHEQYKQQYQQTQQQLQENEDFI